MTSTFCRHRVLGHQAKPTNQIPALADNSGLGSRQPFFRGGLTDERLAGRTEPVTEPGYPEPESYPVRHCLGAVLSEEWEHRLYAERDLDVLESRSRTA